MLNSLVIKSAVAGLFILGTYSFAANRSFTGIVTDDMCARKHTMMPGKPDSDCVRVCAKAGSKHALLVGDKIYKLEGKAEQADKFAGQKIRVAGKLDGDTIQALSLEAVK